MLSRFWLHLSSSLALVVPWGVSVRLVYRVSGPFFALSLESQPSTFFIVGYSVRSTFRRRRFDKCLCRHFYVLSFPRCGIADFLLRPVPGSLQSQVPCLVCVQTFRDLQDRAPFVRQSYFDTLPCEVLMSSRERLCQNTLSNLSSHHISSSLPLLHSADVATKTDG